MKYLKTYNDEFCIYENLSFSLLVKDAFYKECITLAKKKPKDKRSLQAYGALVVKDGKILGRGYNRAIATKGYKLDRIIRQGQANHAEIEAMNDDLINGYDIKNADIYVAGYYTDTNILYFKKEFTCMRCIPYFKQYGIKNVYVPLPDKWNMRSIEDCEKDAILFKGKEKGDIYNNRLKSLVGNYNISLVENVAKTKGSD